MIRSCVRQAVRVFAGVALVGFAWQAFATTFTMNCDSLTLTGTAPNQMLTCNIGSAPPSGCSIQGPSSGVIGTPITLTAACTAGTAPLTYAWSGGSAAGCTNQQQCSVSDNATTTYSVAISNLQGGPVTPTKQVVWSNNPIAPGGCSLNPNPSSLPVGGGPVSLSMDCSTGSGLSYLWTGGFAATATTQQVSGSIAATTTFTATASNSAGSVQKSATVTVATGGGGGSTQCSGFLNTNDKVTMMWPNWTSNTMIAMGPLDAAVITFTTGPVGTKSGSFTLYSGSGAISNHDVFVSATPCDFQTNLLPYLRFTVGTPGSPTIPELQANSTYYINIRNSADAVCLSGAASCNLFINSQKP